MTITVTSVRDPHLDHVDRVRRHLIEGRLAPAVVTGLVEPGESGDWSITTVDIDERDEQIERMRALVSSSYRGRWTPAGTYTQLKRGQVTVMSDTPDEIVDLDEFQGALERYDAERVLIHGLGLGCAVRLALAHHSVRHVDVVELSPDVIRLVAPTLVDERLQIIEGDAYAYRFPVGTRWCVAWHDIWDTISTDNDFAGLHRRYGNRVKWQGSWCRERAIEARRSWERENAWWLS